MSDITHADNGSYVESVARLTEKLKRPQKAPGGALVIVNADDVAALIKQGEELLRLLREARPNIAPTWGASVIPADWLERYNKLVGDS